MLINPPKSSSLKQKKSILFENKKTSFDFQNELTAIDFQAINNIGFLDAFNLFDEHESEFIPANIFPNSRHYNTNKTTI